MTNPDAIKETAEVPNQIELLKERFGEDTTDIFLQQLGRDDFREVMAAGLNQFYTKHHTEDTEGIANEIAQKAMVEDLLSVLIDGAIHSDQPQYAAIEHMPNVLNLAKGKYYKEDQRLYSDSAIMKSSQHRSKDFLLAHLNAEVDKRRAQEAGDFTDESFYAHRGSATV